MKTVHLAFAAVWAVSSLIFGCNKETSFESPSQEEISEMSDMSKILYLLKREGITTSKEGANYMASVCGATIPMTKGNAGYIFDDSVYENVSMEAATVISNFQNVIVNEDDNEQLRNFFIPYLTTEISIKILMNILI